MDSVRRVWRHRPHTDKLFKEHLVKCADILGSSNKRQADFFLWRDTAYTEAQYKEWFGKRKPCIKGSDSHSMNDEVGRLKDHNSQSIERYCWIKADPTFGGLRQIINEPEGRVHIGRAPAKVEEVAGNSTRFIDRITIRKSPGSDVDDSWFDCEVPLSPDMAAIIGNKGSGKSALADILALAGNSHCDTGYSPFSPRTGSASEMGDSKHFTAELHWKCVFRSIVNGHSGRT